jgi:hypothetical protein
MKEHSQSALKVHMARDCSPPRTLPDTFLAGLIFGLQMLNY